MEFRILLVIAIIQSDCILLRTVAAATSSQENSSRRSAPGKGKYNKQFIASQFNLFTLPEGTLRGSHSTSNMQQDQCFKADVTT